MLIEMFDELIRRIDGRGVSKAILWETGNKDIASFKESADFDIVESILPSGRKCVQQTEYAHLDGGESKKLEDLITETKGSTYLIGEGGIGKTTSLIHYADGIYQEGYTEESVVPVYIELGNCTMNNAGLSSKLIHRYILSRMTGATLAAVSDEQISELSKLFSADKSQPEYILMLDGLNEVSDRKSYTTDGSADRPIVTLLIYEITQMIQNCKNVRVILTSRNSDSSFQRIYISGLKDEEVNQFLNEAKISDEKRQAAKNNPTLMEILRIPLFLSIYTRIADNIDAMEMSTRGELLKAFFNEKRKDIYSQINRVDKLHNLPLTGEQYAFILEYVLPQICWEMVHKRTIEIDSETIYDLIYKALSDDHPMYIGFGVRSSIRRMAASLKQVEDEAVRSDPLAAPILNAIKNTLSVFYKKSEDEETQTEILRIRHQQFRDYFAALYFIGLMKSACSSMARRKGNTDEAFGILQEIRDEVIMPDVLVFVGEILGEHKNAPVLVNGKWTYNVPPVEKPQDRNLIKRTLDAFRGRFDGSVGYGIYNLVEILKKVRKDLSRADLSRLDFTSISLNGIKLGHAENDGASFQRTKIRMENLLYQGHSAYVTTVAYAPDGRTFISGAADCTMKEWDSATGHCIRTYTGHSRIINSVAYAPDNKTFISGAGDFRGNRNIIREWNRITGQCVRVYEGHNGSVSSVAYAPDGKTIISGSDDNTIKEWNRITGQCIHTYEGHSDGVSSVIYAPDGKNFISASYDGTIKEWDIATSQCVRIYEGHSGSVRSVAYAPDGKTFISGSSDEIIKEWNVATGQCIRTYEIHSSSVESVAYAPSGRTFIASLGNGTIKEWDIATSQCVCTYEMLSRSIKSLAIASDGRMFISGHGDKTIKEWDIITGRCICVYDGHKNLINSVAYAPNTKTIISGSKDKTIKEWNRFTGQCLRTFTGHKMPVTSVAFSPDGKKILSGSSDTTVKEWDRITGQCIYTYKKHSRDVNTVAYNPNGIIFASGASDYDVREWSKVTRQCVSTYEEHGDSVTSIAYSPDGKFIISGSRDRTIKEWDRYTGQCICTYEGHDWSVNFVSYSPNGSRIISGANDNTIIEWERFTGRCIHIYKGHSDNVVAVIYAPNGKTIISASKDCSIRIWSTETGECLYTIPSIPRLMVNGVDLRHLHPDCSFSNEDKEILRQYGAII